MDALLENAVRHTSDGDMIQLSVMATGAGGPVRMIVADTGAGILPAELAHIFDRFRTGSPASAAVATAGGKGTGLGLALVRAVAHAHGGDARVRSTPGQGSEFELVLPAPAGRYRAGLRRGSAGLGQDLKGRSMGKQEPMSVSEHDELGVVPGPSGPGTTEPGAVASTGRPGRWPGWYHRLGRGRGSSSPSARR